MLIIFDKKNRQEGIKEYLENGDKGDRNNKDKRVALAGDLDIMDKVAKLGKQKGYKEAYRNIVLSFQENKISPEILEKITADFIKMYMAGYKTNEYVYYAEAHYPKKKVKNYTTHTVLRPKQEKRHIHVHVGIAKFSPTLQHQLDLGDHSRRLREIRLIQEFLETKYSLQGLKYKKVISNAKSEIFEFDKYKTKNLFKKKIEDYIYLNIDHYNSLDDLINDISSKFDLKIKKSKKANTSYISIKAKQFNSNIRLKGELFNDKNFLEAKKSIIKNNNKVKITTKPKRNLDEIAKELKAVRESRIKRINKRVENIRIKQKSKKINVKLKKKVKNYISYQEKLLSQLYDNYNFSIFVEIKKGYFIKKYENTNIVLIRNKKKNVKIIDKGNEITAEDTNLFEQAKIMIEMAVAKKWDLSKVKIRGSEEFKKIAKKLIADKLKDKAKLENLHRRNNKKLDIPKFKTSNVVNSKIDELKTNEKIKELDFKTLKEILTADFLLEHLDKKGLINKSIYKIINNKIQVGRDKYNIIDFCIKEMHLSFKETNTLLNSVYKDMKLEDFTKDKNNIIDWKSVKQNLHPQVVADFYRIKIDSKQIWKKGDEWRIRIKNKNYNIIDFLMKEQNKSFKEIANDYPKIKEYQSKYFKDEDEIKKHNITILLPKNRKNIKNIKNIVVCKSIDSASSYIELRELNSEETIIVVASAGIQFNDKTLTTFNNLFKQYDTAKKILAVDNDDKDTDKYISKIKQQFQFTNLKVDKSVNKDFTEDLKKYKKLLEEQKRREKNFKIDAKPITKKKKGRSL